MYRKILRKKQEHEKQLQLGDDSGIKCDNPTCDYISEKNVSIEEAKDWIDRPCPKCGANLLTKKSYKTMKRLINFIEVFNFIAPARKEGCEDKYASMLLDVNYDGKLDIRIDTK